MKWKTSSQRSCWNYPGWEGKPVEVNTYQDCQKLGVACIYQELSVIPPLTVAQNVFLGREPRNGPFIDYAKMNQMTQELIDKYEFPLKPTTVVDNLGIGQSYEVEIYDPLLHTFKGFGCLDQKRVSGAAVELDGGRVMIVGNWYADDGIELFDGKGTFSHVRNVSQTRCVPHL